MVVLWNGYRTKCGNPSRGSRIGVRPFENVFHEKEGFFVSKVLLNPRFDLSRCRFVLHSRYKRFWRKVLRTCQQISRRRSTSQLVVAQRAFALLNRFASILQYRVVVPDLPGHGRSTGIHVHCPSMEALVDAVYEVVKDVALQDSQLVRAAGGSYTQKRKTFVAGQSLGGFTAAYVCL